MTKKHFLWIVSLASLVSAMILLLILEASGQAAPSQSQTNPGNSTSLNEAVTTSDLYPNCRLGVAADDTQVQAFDIVSNLGASWYLAFGTRASPPSFTEAEFVQMVHITQTQALRGGGNTCGPDYDFQVSPALTDTALGARVDANPGNLWIVGNETDRINQGDVCPQQYAEAYHDVYQFIKGRDPTARIATTGLVEVTPGRMQYLDIVWDTYLAKYGITMPVDVWTMHVYVLSETGEGDAHIALGTDPGLAIGFSFNCADPNTFCQAEHDDIDYFVDQVVLMREWMKDHGQQSKPLIITEYGILKPYNYPGIYNDTCPPGTTTCPPGGADGCFCDENNETYHPERVADYEEATFDYLMTATDPQLGYPADEYRLVQQWLWYRLATKRSQDLGHASNLIYTDTYTFTIPGERWHNYVAAIPPTVNLLLVDVPLVTEYAANGTDPVTATLPATILNNGNFAVSETVTVTFYSNESLTASIGSATFTNLGGCAMRRVVVTTTWENLSSGIYPFWAKVDSGETIAETKEWDNVASGIVFVNPQQRFLPLILKDE